MSRPVICYLCGLSIESNSTKDHVPPQQFYASELRRQFNFDKLTTLPTHSSCNADYCHDEEYVVAQLAPLAIGQPAANVLVLHHTDQYRSGKKVGLIRKILSSFDDRPSGLYLPNGRVVMRLDGERIKRVVWKIVRGLYYLEYRTVLPEYTKYLIEINEPGNTAISIYADFWEEVKAQPSKGVYQGVFAYKHLKLEKDGIVIYLWGMLWWNRVMVFMAHLNPQ